MSRRRDVRDRWFAEVVRTRLVSGSCRELMAYVAVKHMTELGHVKVPRATLAAALDIAEHRVTVRMSEAVKAGLLHRSAGGVNGQTMQYTALPFWGQGAASRHPRPEVEVSGKRHPQDDTQEAASGCRDAAPIRVRVSKTNREHLPAPADSRAESDHDDTAQDSAYGSWLPTSSKRPSSLSVEGVA
jgi:hypothetical protein